MVERLIVVLSLAVVALGVFQGLRLAHMQRIRRTTGESGRMVSTLLYFHSDQCAACPTQGRMVDQVAGKWEGRLVIERIDVEREPETATRYGVFSLPTTILIDRTGQVRQVNYGLTHAAKLERQLAELA